MLLRLNAVQMTVCFLQRKHCALFVSAHFAA